MPGPGRRWRVRRIESTPNAEEIRGLLSSPQSLVAWETNVIQNFFLTLPAGFLLESLLAFDLEEVVKHHTKCHKMEINH